MTEQIVRKISRWERHEYTPSAYEGAADFDRFEKWRSLRQKARTRQDIPGYGKLADEMLRDYWEREALTPEEYAELQAQRDRAKVDAAWVQIIERTKAREAAELAALTQMVEETGL